jgi:hypothetical protein
MVPASLPPSALSPNTPFSAADRVPGAVNAPYADHSELALVQSESPAWPPNTRPAKVSKRNIAITAVSAVGSVVVGGLMMMWLRSDAIEPERKPVVVPIVSPASAPQPVESAVTAESAPIVTPEPIVAPAASTAAPRPTAQSRPSRPPPPPKNCDPPYFYDGRGLKVFKKECL